MVKLLLITHDGIGSALLNAANTALGTLPLAASVITVSYDTNPDTLIAQLDKLLKHSSKQDDWLVLTDLYGSTPCNIATKLKTKSTMAIVSGLNLPMLLRVMNYSKLPLAELTQKAMTGGKDGIIQWNKQDAEENC